MKKSIPMNNTIYIPWDVTCIKISIGLKLREFLMQITPCNMTPCLNLISQLCCGVNCRNCIGFCWVLPVRCPLLEGFYMFFYFFFVSWLSPSSLFLQILLLLSNLLDKDSLYQISSSNVSSLDENLLLLLCLFSHASPVSNKWFWIRIRIRNCI